jgi:hypothetical protein
MLRWGMIAAAAVGTVRVKESEAESRFYDSARETATYSLRRWIRSRLSGAERQEARAGTNLDNTDHERSASNVR